MSFAGAKFNTLAASVDQIADGLILQLTSSLLQPVKFPGCKMPTYTPANSIFDGHATDKFTFNTVPSDGNPFTCSCEGVKKALMILNSAFSLDFFRVHGSERI